MTKQNLIKRFFARFMRARAASAAPAFFFAAAAAGFALAPLDASAARISETVETGDFGDASDQSLAVGSGNITIGGDVSVNVTETTLLTGTQLTISSTSDTLDFGNVTFQQPVASDSITVSGENVSVAFDKVTAGTGYGKIDVADGAELVINGDANLSAITAENGTLTVKGKATVETLTAKKDATVTLEAADASGVNSLVMAGGTVKVKDFALDKVAGTNGDNNASGTISSSGTLTVNPGITLTTEELNLKAKENGVIDLKNGSEIDLGTGTVSLGANAQLNIGDAEGAADLTAKSLTAADDATTTLNGGTLTLNGNGIPPQNLDSLAESSTGTVSVSGEGARAVFSEDKTFENASGEVLDIAVAKGTLQVDAAVSTTGTVSAKNLTIGDADSSVKASAFKLSPEGTLTMGGGTLDLSATSNETTDIYAIAEGSSGTITEGDTAGTIALNKTSTGLGELNFTAESGTVKLTGTAEAPITVETAGDVNARNLVVGANMLVGDNVTVGKATERTGDGLTLNGGTLTGTTNVTVNKVVEKDLSGTVDGGTVIFDLDQKENAGETVVAGTLNLGSAATDTNKTNTNKVWIRGEGLTLGEGSVVTATGDVVDASNGTATGLVVGGAAADTATIFDLSAAGTQLNVNAVNVYCNDELKLSGDQKIGIGDKDGKIWLGVAQGNGSAAGKISTTGTLTSLGQTTMNGGRIESIASSPAPAPEQPEEGAFYPEATIHLGDVAMGNGVISAVNGSVKVAAVSDQGIIAAKDISVGSVSDDDTDKVILAGSENGLTAADKLTFTGTTASDISANADSVVNTKALELADGVNVTIGSETNKNILNEENLASVALGGGASLNTTSGDLSALTSVALATGTADDRTTWTHSSGIAVNGDVSVGNDASIDADGAVSVVGSVSVGNRSDITAESINFGDADLKIGGTATLTSETGDVTLGGVLGLEDGVLATATVNSAADIVFAAASTSSLHLKATGDIVVNENVSVTLSQGEIDARNTTLNDGSTFKLLGNNNVLGGTGTPEENPYELSEVTLGNEATLKIGGNNPAAESEFYETFAKADSVKNAADAVGTIEVNGADETTEAKVSVFTAGTVGDATSGGVNVTLNEGGELVATGADAAGVGIYAAALNGTGGKLTAQTADGTKNDIYVTASNTVGKNIAFTADELRVTDLDVDDGADVAVRLENADLDGVNSLVVADAAAAGTDETTTLTLAGTSSVDAVTVGKDGNNGTLIVESLPAEGEEPAAPVVVIGDLAEGETANFQTGSLTLDGGALVATGGSIDVRAALAAGTNGLDGTLEAKDVRVDLSAQEETFGAALTLKGETVTLDGNVGSGFALGSVVDADKLVIGSDDAEGETTAVIVADPATTLDGVEREIVVENGDSLIVESAWAPEQTRLTVTLDTDATLGVTGALTVDADKSFAVNAAVDGEGNVAEPNVAVFDEIVNNGNFSLGNVVANAASWTDADGATLTITGTKTDTEERLASLDISGAADGTTTFNSTVSLTNGALAVAQGNVALNGAVVSENGTVDVEAGDLTANDTVSLTDSTVTADGDVALNGAVSSANGAITAENGSMTVSGGAGTIESLGLTAGADITFDTNEFDAEGAVTVVAAQGTGNVTFDTDVSLGAGSSGEGSSVAADTLTVNAGAAGTIKGTVDVETIVLSGATSAPDPVKDAASLTISGEGDSTFATLTNAAGTTLSLTNGATLKQNGDATASVSLNGTLSVADANSAFSTPGSLTLANTAKLTLANGGAANIAGTLDLSASTTGAVTVDGTGTGSDATTTLTAGTLVINPADAANNTTQGVVSLTNGGQFTVGELAAGSTVTLTGQNGSGNIWVDETSHFTLKKGDIAVTESTFGEIVAESGDVTFGHDAVGNGVYELAGIGTHGLDLSLNSGHNEVNFTMSESLNADGETYTYSKVVVRGMMNLQGTDVSATGAEGRRDFAVSVASGVNLNNANLTLENVAFSGGESVSLTGSSELRATNTTIDGFDAIITTVGANNSSITLNNATLNTDVTMNSGTLNVGVEGATIGAGYTVSVNENVSAKLEGNLTGDGKLALNGGNVSLTGDKFTLDNVVVNAANAKISGGKTLTIGNLEIGTGDALTVDAALSASGDWNINGGSLTAGTLTIEGGANVALTNSTVTGDITFADGADAELSLTESTVAGNVTLDGGNNTLKVTDSSITGTLEATAGSITFKGTNSFGDLRLVSDVNIGGVLDVVGKLEVAGGFELEKASELSTTEGLFVNGGTATLAGTVTQGDVTLTGTDEGSTLSGTIETNLTLDAAQLTQTDGEVVGSTKLTNGSKLTQTEDGSLGAVFVDASNFTQEAGTAGAVSLTNGASATLAGTVASLDATNATAEVSGKVVGSTTLATGSKLTQTDGTLGAVSADASTFTQNAGTATAGAVTLTNGASATLAGTVASLAATNATAEVSGMVSDDMTLTNATAEVSGEVVGSTTLANDSALTQTAGSLHAVSVDASTFTQNAGTAGAVTLTNGSTLTQTDGSLGAVTLTNGASATLAGTVASLDATNATAEVSGEVSGDMTLTNATANVSGTISGDMTLNNAQLTQTDGEVVGSTTLANDSTLTQTAGTLGAVSVDASTFTQESAGTAGAVTLTNGASATLAGTVASLDATNASAEVSGMVSDDMTLTNAQISSSGTVEGSTTLANDSALTQTDGTLGAVSADASTFTQNAGTATAGAVTLTNGASATLAGTVASLAATNATAEVSGMVSDDMTLTNATAEVSGEVVGSTTLANDSALTQTAGSLHAVSVDASTFTQNAGTAGAVTLTNGSTLTQTDGSLGAVTLTNGASATLAGTVASLDATNATAEVSGEVSGDMTLTNATAEVSGTVSGDMTLTNATAEVSGTVEGSTTLANVSTLTQTAGTLGAVSVDASTFTQQNAGTAGKVTLTNNASATLAGTVASLDATNAKANVSGTVSGDMTLTNATANVSGTVEGAVSLDASTLKAQGDKTFASLSLKNDSTLVSTDDITVTGAITDASGSISGASIALNGGLTGSASVTASEGLTLGGVWNVNGGSLTAGTLTIADGANVALTNSTVAGDITFADGAAAELSLTESTVAGNVTLDGENNMLKVTDSSITGTLEATAGSITFNGTNSFGNLRLDSDVNIGGVVAVDGKLEVEGGFELGKASELSTTEGLFVNGGTATLAGTVTQGDVTLTGTIEGSTLSGTIETNLTLDAAQLTQKGGEVVGNTTLTNDSKLTQTGGTLGAVSVDASTFTQEATGTAGAVTLTNDASATLAGTVASLDATNASAEVSGMVSDDMTLTNAQISSSGTVEGSTTLANDSALTQTGGALGAVSVSDSTFTQNAGTAGPVTLTNGSTLTQTDGSLGAVTLTNGASATLAGTVDSLDATNATANVSGTIETKLTLNAAQISSSGTVEGSTTLANDSTLTQTDGSLGAVSVDASTFTQEAGTAGAVTLTNGSTLTQTDGSLGAVTLTNGTSATLAGTVASLDATNAKANVSGTVSGAVSLDASTLTAVDGITISDTLTAENNSIVNGDIMLDGAADVSLSGSTVTGDIAFAESANGADLKLIESTVDGNVTLSGGSNSLRVENSSITGALTATAGTITFDGENSFGDLQLSGDVNVAGDITVNGALNAEGGFNLAGSSSLSTTEGLFVNGGTANLAGTVTQGDVTLTGTIEGSTLSGTIETNLTLDAAQLTQTDGEVVGSTTLANGSTLTQTGGTLGAVSVDASTFTQESAGTAGAVTLANDASATLAGTVASLDATNATANVSGTVSGDMTLNNAQISSSGTVDGITTLANGSALTQTGGTLGAVSVDASTFTQESAGTAGAVTLANDASATLAGTVDSLYATNATANVSGKVSGDMTLTNATAEVSGTVEGAVSLDASTLTAQGDKTFASLSLKNDSTLVSTDDITVTGAITDASGSISGVNVALNGGLTGSASVSASGDLTLGGTTATSGSLTAKNGTLTVAEGGTLTATDAQVEAGTLAVNEGATLNLTIEEGLGDDTKLSIAGTANLTAENALTLSNLSGAGTANKTGAGALTLSGNGAFTGALNIGAGNASLSGAFGGSIGFASEGGTITGARGASVAGTLTLAQGTTLEIGDASGAANLTVGKIALADATTRAAGTAKVVHDVFADGTNTLMTDTLTVTDATANLSGLTAVVRSNVDEEILGVGGQTITLVEGDVAAGYGFIEGIGFDRTNAVLSEDGKSLQVMLNWKAAADGLAGSLFNDNQRAVAAATKSWDASTNKYAQALSTLSTTETAAALDDLGALHTVAMMPGQIDGTWNHQKSVLNAIGTGSQMGYQFGKPDVNMGAWVQYVGSYNDVDSSSDRLGWDRTMNGATAGFEYALSENFLAGVALGYEYAELKSDGNKIEDDAFSVDFFAKHRSGDFEQRAALTFAHHGYDTNRTIAFGGVAESVSGDTDGFTAAIAYEAAYNFAVKEYLTLAPVATLRAALNTIDGWSESGSDAALKFDDQSAFTALAGIGGRAEFAFANPSYSREALRLSAYALFTAEFGDRSSDVDASFVRGGNAFTMTYDDPEPYALQLGLTAFAPLTNRTALFGGISTELRDEESGFNANIGVRIGW